jgi:hypothetical protein
LPGCHFSCGRCRTYDQAAHLGLRESAGFGGNTYSLEFSSGFFFFQDSEHVFLATKLSVEKFRNASPSCTDRKKLTWTFLIFHCHLLKKP